MSTASLLWGVVAGAVGAGYFLYGRRQQAMLPLVCGLGLMVVPALLDDTWALAASCLALSALPFVWRR